MKNLLFKELRLCVPAQAWIYFALVACVLIPGWPPIVGLFYVTVSVMIIFPIAHANRDALFTALLPVRKQPRELFRPRRVGLDQLHLYSI